MIECMYFTNRKGVQITRNNNALRNEIITTDIYIIIIIYFYLLMLLHDSYYSQRMLWEDYCLMSHVPSKWTDEVLYCHDYHHHQQQLLAFPFVTSSQKKGLWCQFLSNFNVQKTRSSRIVPTKAIGAVKTNEKLLHCHENYHHRRQNSFSISFFILMTKDGMKISISVQF